MVVLAVRILGESKQPPNESGANAYLLSLSCAMASRVRHCVECPKCHTRYLLRFSRYGNGSFLRPLAEAPAAEWTLFCSCARPHISSRWNWSEVKRYSIAAGAYERGYGPPDEVVALNTRSQLSR